MRPACRLPFTSTCCYKKPKKTSVVGDIRKGTQTTKSSHITHESHIRHGSHIRHYRLHPEFNQNPKFRKKSLKIQPKFIQSSSKNPKGCIRKGSPITQCSAMTNGSYISYGSHITHRSHIT